MCEDKRCDCQSSDGMLCKGFYDQLRQLDSGISLIQRILQDDRKREKNQCVLPIIAVSISALAITIVAIKLLI